MSLDPAQVVTTIHALLAARAPSASICPSEVARALAPTAWREHMTQVREVAAAEARRGALRITQGDRELSPDVVSTGRVRGPLRLRRGHAPAYPPHTGA